MSKMVNPEVYLTRPFRHSGIIGAALFAEFYPVLEKRILSKGDFGDLTLPRLLKVNPWVIVIPFAIGIIAFLFWIETSGL